MRDFSNLTVVIKTFMRYNLLQRTMDSLRPAVPGCQIIVVDDTPKDRLQTVEAEDVVHLITEPDIGLAEGRNVGIRAAKTTNVFYTDDDHLMLSSPDEFMAAYRIFLKNKLFLLGWVGYRMSKRVVDGYPELVMTRESNTSECYRTDITNNTYFLRRRLVEVVPFDPQLKIHGEHVDWFLRLKKEKVPVHASNLLNFKNLGADASDTVYNEYRNRSCFRFVRKRWGITRTVWEK